jgi:TolB-like protein/DNA-binding winged helix-turn-helix (wHTH) protein/Tfp pilus assembly protein PilF
LVLCTLGKSQRIVLAKTFRKAPKFPKIQREINMNRQSARRYGFGSFRLDVNEHMLSRNGRPVPLSPKIFEVLRVLVENHGRLVEKDKLLKEVWPDSFVEESNLNHSVSILRKVLGDNHSEKKYIETVPKRGYRFVAPVTINIDVSPPVEGVEAGSDWLAPHGILHANRRQIFRGLRWAGLIFGMAGLLAIALSLHLHRAATAGPGFDSVAVLPFTNTTGDPDAEYLSDGIAEAVINDLSRIPTLRVIARTTAFTYKGKGVDPRKIGRALNVRAVLTGKLARHLDALVLQVDLIDVAAGTQLWGERYAHASEDLFAVQNEIGLHILDTLKVRLNGEERKRLANRYTENVEAHQLYLKGRYHSSKMTREGTEKAFDQFFRALRLDPTYALAYAGLAELYIIAPDWYLPSPEAGVKAKEAALKALAMDETLGEAHGALAFVLANHERDWSTAEREFKRALELSPGSVLVHCYYGEMLGMTGRAEESIREQKRAQELDPLSAYVSTKLGMAFYWARRYDDAIEQFRQAIDLDPTFWQGHTRLAMAYEQKAMYDEAVAEYRAAASLKEFRDGPAWLGRGLAVSGKMTEARKLLDNIMHSRTVGPWGLAVLYGGLGEKDRAFEWLTKAFDDHFVLIGSLKVEPLFDSLRADPRFEKLLQGMSLAR